MLSNRLIGIIVKQVADRRLLRQFLSDMELSCIEASTFDDVETSDNRWREVGLLLVDEYNADHSGEEILRFKIREVAAYLPILALSSDSTSPAHLLEQGFDDVLRIPITMSEFKARILAFLRLREASEQRFQTLFESTPIGIFRVAPTGRLLVANPALVRMLGFRSLDEAKEASMKRPDLTPVRSTGSYVGEAVWRSASGSGIPVLVRSAVTRDDSGRPLYVEGTVEDLTDRKAIETALRDHAARLTLALDAAAMGDIDLDFESETIDCAHLVYRLFGFDSEPVDRSLNHLLERILPNDRRAVRRAIRDAVRTGETLDQEFRIRWPDGTDRWLRARGEVMYDDDQQAERLVGVIRDTTDEKRVQIDLIRAKVEAEQLAALKSTFLANMSHEIRTPLTAIIGFASLLAGRVTDDQRGAVTRIQEGGQRLLETLNAILTLARLESRQMDLLIEDVDVVKEARGTLDMFETQARDKGLRLAFEATVPSARSRLDRGALNSILQNLFSNAIKFTEKVVSRFASTWRTLPGSRRWSG
jgi:PAS domain S-box-containing protein